MIATTKSLSKLRFILLKNVLRYCIPYIFHFMIRIYNHRVFMLWVLEFYVVCSFIDIFVVNEYAFDA